MSTHKSFDKICAAVMIFAVLLTVLFMNGESLGLERVVDADAETYDGSEYFSAKDLDGSWDTGDAAQIVLEGDAASIRGNGAYMLDGNLVISEAGDYVVSGELTDGSLVVDTYKNAKVRILLDGVTITCSDDACIRVDQADKVFLTLAEGSENVLQSGEAGSEEALEDGTDGIIFSHDDLTINGSGSLRLSGGWKHGIGCNDDLVITGGVIDITAAADGMHANNGIYITGDDTAITISAADDAVHADEEIVIEGGRLDITECYEGLEAVQIFVNGGDTVINASDDGINANGGGSEGWGMGFGGGNMAAGGMGSTAGADASDDAESTAGAAAAENEDEETLQPLVEINGGSVTILNRNGNDADGIDSNRDIVINGGSVMVSLNGNGGNNALDYGSENGGSCAINGGTVIAAGGSSMLESISDASAQVSITYICSQTASEDTEVRLADSEGTELLSGTVPYGFTALVISAPGLTTGETCTLTFGEETAEVSVEQTVTTAGAQAGGMMQGGMGQGGGMGRGGMKGQGGMGRSGMMGQGGMGQGGMTSPGAADGTQTGAADSTQTGAETADAGQTEQNDGTAQDEMTSEDPEAAADMGAFPGGPGNGPMQGGMIMPGNGEMPEGMEMPGNGEMPEGMGMPEGMEMTEGAPAAESEGETGQNMSFQKNGMRQGGMGMSGQTTQQETETSGTGKSLQSFDAETWLFLGVSLLVMAAGLVFAGVFPRRRP